MALRLAAMAALRSGSAVTGQPAGVLLSGLAAFGGLAGVTGHRQAPAQLHSTALQLQNFASQEPGQLDRKAMVNRMLYRSRQRGFLELDLLIGMWAEQELPRMPVPMLRDFEVVLDQENPDMFKWITGQAEAPEELQQNSAFRALRTHVGTMMERNHSVPSAGGADGKEWLRGWNDSGKELGPNPEHKQ